jgi:hypothetical protein
LSTYITIRSQFDFLIVRGVQNRLVVTLPEDVHDLRSTRFYIVLYSVGAEFQPVVDRKRAKSSGDGWHPDPRFDFKLSATGNKDEHAYGAVFFRQDQPRIDLFVFFSVFFSSFFLLLAVCVVAWKVKRFFDLRRAQQRHVVEMQHMAKRPVGRVIVIFDEDDLDEAERRKEACKKRRKTWAPNSLSSDPAFNPASSHRVQETELQTGLERRVPSSRPLSAVEAAMRWKNSSDFQVRE